jgi:predicted AlkP superfamily phosphohydrolase/phosphomutase
VPEVTLIAEWHVHDQLWGSGSNPPELFAELEAIHGSPHIDRCDMAHRRTLDGYETWAGELLDRLRSKVSMLEDLLGRKDWDLFTVAFSEGHCAGHQMWHLHDPAWHAHPSGCSDRQRGLLEEVYVALDAAVGRVIDAAGPGATTLVFTSHGMGPYIGGTQLLPDVLRGLGLGDGRRLPPWIRPVLPVHIVQKAWARFPGLRRATAGTVLQQRGFVRPGVKAIAVHNNRVGAIRLNVRGREPAGEVDPAAADDLMADITEELLDLRHATSGERVVARVVRTADEFGPGRHPDLPDLLVVFRRDLGELSTVIGPRVGTISRAVQRPDYPRTGDHTDVARLWCQGPGAEALPAGRTITTLDLAPAILSMVGLEQTA